MDKLNLKHLRLVVIFMAFSSSVKAEISNEEFSMIENTGCISYYARETGVRSEAFCRFLCGREESCTGVGIENVGRTVNCYLFSRNKVESTDLNPSSAIKHWIKKTFAGIDGNSCYYPVFSGTALNWTEAEKACQNLHSRYHLISLETDEEQTAISKYMGREGQGIIWTGGKDMDGTNTYRWIGTGNAVSLEPALWYPYEPDHHGDCVFMHGGDGHMHAHSCASKFYFICEITM